MNRIIEIKEREEPQVKISRPNKPKRKDFGFLRYTITFGSSDLINQYTASKNLITAAVTAHDGKLSEQHLRDFQDNEKAFNHSHHFTEVKYGVDAPEVRNIVLLVL